MTAAAVAWFGVGSNVGKVVACDADNGWSGSLNVDTVNFVEGSASLGEKVSSATVEIYTVNTTDVVGEPFDFSSGGGNDGDHIYAWLNIFAAWDTLANGGFGLRVIDDLAPADSEGTWYVGPQVGYLGGWASYVIDPSADFDGVVAGAGVWTTTGNPAQLSGVDGFGCRWKTTVSITGNTDNAFVDCISVGCGYTLTLGDAGSAEGVFADFITFEDSNHYGAIREVSGAIFAKCKLYIGAASGATNTEFIDSGFKLTWETQVLSDGTSSAVAAGFYELKAQEATGTTDIDLSAGSLAAASPHTVVIDFSGVNSVALAGINVDRAASITLDTACTWDGGQITNSGLITVAGSTFENMIVESSTVAADASAVNWDVNTDPDGYLDGTSITKGTNSHHAIEFGTTIPATITLRNMDFSGFTATEGQTNSTLYFADTTGTITVNLVGCTGAIGSKSAGATIVLVPDPVTTQITVNDEDGDPIENARVVLIASDGTGDLPYQASVTSITRSGAVATVTQTAHGLTTGDFCYIRGANQPEYNVCAEVTYLTANTFTFAVNGTPVTATGTIVNTGGIFNTLTNASGIVTDTRAIANQPVTGWARKSTSSPFYAQTAITGEIDTTLGLSIILTLASDE